jgi:hypothetical protein
MRRLAYSTGVVLLSACVGWALGAIRAGLFIGDRAKTASEPDERSMEAFSREKKFVDVGSWKVAYIDQGSGDPIRLSRFRRLLAEP